MQWTAPYFGITHLELSSATRATVSDHGAFAVLARWTPGCGYSPALSQHESVAAAKRVAEEWIEQLA